MASVRRVLVAVAAALPLLLALAGLQQRPAPEAQEQQTVTLVGQKFTEADVLTQLYKRAPRQGRLRHAGRRTSVRATSTSAPGEGPRGGGGRLPLDVHRRPQPPRQRRGRRTGRLPDETATLAQLTPLGEDLGITPLLPARAEGGKAYAVTKAFAERSHLTTLSDLGRLGTPVALAAEPDCAVRQDCGPGLEKVYGVKLSKIEPLGLASGDNTRALVNGTVQLAQVGATDGTLDRLGVVILEDDKNWQNAENVVPVVNSEWLEDNPKAKAELDKLSAVLTTADLRSLNAKVDGQRLEASQVAEDYLKEKGLI